MSIKGSPDGFTEYRRNGWHYGGKLTRKNFDDAIELIKRCNENFTNGKIVIDKKAGTIDFPITSPTMQPTLAKAQLGDYLLRDVMGGWGEVRVYKPGDFKSRFAEKVSYRELRFYSLSEVEYQVLQALQHDTDLCYGYDWIMDYTKVDRAETKKAVDHLRELHIIEFHRGLMNDDGEVAGSGFGINDMTKELMAELLCLRYEQRRIPDLGKGDTVGFKGFGDAIDKQTARVVDIKGDVMQLEIIHE